MRQVIWFAVAFSALACTKQGEAANATPSTPPVAGTIAANPAQDTDVAAHGSSLPAGYSALLDKADAKISDASYTATAAGDGRWEVRTGPAHILYSPKDTAKGTYSVTATFEQLEQPKHPEAYGVFIGGSSLNNPAAQKYTYFIVRGDGKYMVKVRTGATVRTVTDWTANPAVPVQDSAGKGLYGIKIDVSGKTAHVSVNGKPVTTLSAKDGPLDGITGVRINHNLHVMVTPVTVTRS